MTLRAIVLTLGACGAVAGGAHPRAAQTLYSKVTEIPIGGAGSFDYLNIDSAAKRLYVTHGTEIVVIDTTTNQIVGRIADTPRVHGIAIVPELDRGFTTNGGENKVGIVDLKTLQTLSQIETGANPDAVLYEPSRKEVYSFNGARTGGFNATVIDAVKGEVVSTIDLGDKPETGQSDPALGQVFVTHRIYTAAQKFGAPDPNAPPPAAGARGRGGPPALPDSFHVLVFEMKR